MRVSFKATGADITYLRHDDGTHDVMSRKGRETTPAMNEFFTKRLLGPMVNVVGRIFFLPADEPQNL